MWYICRNGHAYRNRYMYNEGRLTLTNKIPTKSTVNFSYSAFWGTTEEDDSSWLVADKCTYVIFSHELSEKLYPEVTFETGYKIISDEEAENIISNLEQIKKFTT